MQVHIKQYIEWRIDFRTEYLLSSVHGTVFIFCALPLLREISMVVLHISLMESTSTYPAWCAVGVNSKFDAKIGLLRRGGHRMLTDIVCGRL